MANGNQMKHLGDLRNKKLIVLKALLFAMIILLCAGILLVQIPTLQTILLLLLLIWASARLYYFMFYVIENYLDTEYRFSGIYSCLKYLWNHRK